MMNYHSIINDKREKEEERVREREREKCQNHFPQTQHADTTYQSILQIEMMISLQFYFLTLSRSLA